MALKPFCGSKKELARIAGKSMGHVGALVTIALKKRPKRLVGSV
jgi:hypothetical protein